MPIKFTNTKELKYNLKNIYKDVIFIGIIGSRKLENCNICKDIILEKLENIKKFHSNIMLISGGAKGIDKLAEEIALEYDYDIIVILPDYKNTYHKRAPLERNDTIAYVSDYLIAIKSKDSKNSGTEDTIKKFIQYHGDKSKLFETII